MLELAINIAPKWIAVVAAMAVLCYLMLRNHAKRIRNTPAPREYAHQQISKLKEQQKVKDEMSELLVELHELSRQINAQMDMRFAKLEVSIQAADRRIEELKRLADQKPPGGVQPSLDVVIDDTRAPEEPAPSESDPASSNTKPTEDAGFKQIYALADAGHSAVKIAQKTGKTTGEIELILALRQRSGSA